jgi:predicted metal-dependent phosphoesterase TrpH
MASSVPGYIDLHLHSNYSDGALSVASLVEEAARLELTTMAIADHDSVSGVTEGEQRASLAGIEFITATELSVQFRTFQDVHLLGYGLDHTDSRFLATLNTFRERRERRNEEILARVNIRLSHEGRRAIPLDEVLTHARDAIGRPHIARALLERGYVKNVEDAFRRYLIPCNVPKQYWAMEDAITEIRRLGGISILAHPTSISQDRQELWRVITELAEHGLDGIEVYNNQAQPDEMEFLRRRAEEAGLLLTAGSDFHGIEAGLEMGRGRGGIRFSSALLTPLRQRLAERRKRETAPLPRTGFTAGA